jgi:hypothetical protein
VREEGEREEKSRERESLLTCSHSPTAMVQRCKRAKAGGRMAAGRAAAADAAVTAATRNVLWANAASRNMAFWGREKLRERRRVKCAAEVTKFQVPIKRQTKSSQFSRHPTSHLPGLINSIK